MKYNGFYLVGNYPDEETFLQAATIGLHYFDFMEVGLPFSDPIADGPVLASASHKALQNGVTTDNVLNNIKKIKDYIINNNYNKKIYIMTYANKVYHTTIDRTIALFADSGVDGIILADVPYKESARFKQYTDSYHLDYIHFITPESTHTQIQQVCADANGFIYAISMRGTTGNTLTLDNTIIDILQLTKQYAKIPVVLGFGIQNNHDVQQALHYTDGFIIGTALEKKLEEGLNEYKQFINQLQAHSG